MSYLALYIHQSNWRVSGSWLGAIILLLLPVLAFELWMLIDVAINTKVPTTQKIWWIIGMFLIHPIVAIVYFFVSRFHYNKLK